MHAIHVAIFYTCTGMFFTGDGAARRHGGYLQITGRMDDIINVTGHRLGTAEIEDVLVRVCRVLLTFTMLS